MGKVFFSSLSTFVLALCSVAFVACSSDDDDENGNDIGNFDAPAFETDAAKYEIQDASSAYNSIELTASGNYIIQKNSSNYAPSRALTEPIALKTVRTFTSKRPMTRASEYANILYGKYTKLSDGEYALEGFGTIKINFNSSSNAYSLEVTPNGGATETVTASKAHVKADSGMTNSLCRTWKFTKFRNISKLNGRTLYDITYTDLGDFYQKAYDATGDETWLEDLKYYQENPSEEGDTPEEVIFTKSGTYIVKYKHGTLAVSFWRWYNADKGIMQYSWNDTFEDEEETCNIKFDGNQCVVYDNYSETYEGSKYEGSYYSYMEEVK